MKDNRTFYSYLQQQDIKVFKTSQIGSYFGKLDDSVYKIIDTMVGQGVLYKLRKGLYAVNSIPGQPSMPNWHLIAEAMVYPNPYYVAFGSALEIHNLTTQPLLREYIVSDKRMLPKVQMISNIPFEMVTMASHKFYGFKKTWITNFDKVMCSDIEKTIIDCLAAPQYAGGMEGIIKAIDMAKDKIKPNVLVDYAFRYKTQAVVKRLGYLLQTLSLFPTEQNILQHHISKAYTKLDPSIKTSGRFISQWHIEDNVNIHDIVQTINT